MAAAEIIFTRSPARRFIKSCPGPGRVAPTQPDTGVSMLPDPVYGLVTRIIIKMSLMGRDVSTYFYGLQCC